MSGLRCCRPAGWLLPALIVAGCATPTDQPPAASVSPAAAVSAMTMDALMNLTYTLPDGSEIALRDGFYQELPAQDAATFVANYSLAWDLAAFGDLTGDGTEDAAVILINAPGGSGTYTYLAAVVEEAGMPVNTSTILLGDRVNIESHEVADAASRLEVVAHGPDDPMCCPTERRAWGHSLVDGQLVKSSDELLGSVKDEG